MRSSRLALAFLAALAFALPARGAGLAITNIGNNSAAAGSNTLAITTTGACPAGNQIVVFAGVTTAITISSVADDHSNTYGLSGAVSLASARQKFGTSNPKQNTAGLPTGSAITVTYSTTTGTKLAAAACILGVQAIGNTADTDGTGTTGTGTAPSMTVPNPPISNGEIIVCGYLVTTGAGDTFTNTAGFSPLTQVSNVSTLNWEYKIISDFSQQTCAPTLGTSRVWGASGRGYIQTQGARAMSGVGQ